MARLHLHPDRLEIALSTAEKTLSLRKDNVVIPRSAIRSATLTDDPWIWVRGIRAPGTAIPLTLAVGQWKFHGGKDFLVLKGTKPSVVIDIADDEFSRVIVTTKFGLELIANLQLDVKPAKKTARTRQATPKVTPKPKRVAKVVTDADSPEAADDLARTEGIAVVTPETAVAAAKARAPRAPRTAAAKAAPKVPSKPAAKATSKATAKAAPSGSASAAPRAAAKGAKKTRATTAPTAAPRAARGSAADDAPVPDAAATPTSSVRPPAPGAQRAAKPSPGGSKRSTTAKSPASPVAPAAPDEAADSATTSTTVEP